MSLTVDPCKPGVLLSARAPQAPGGSGLVLSPAAALAVDVAGRAARPGVLSEAAALAVDGTPHREPPRLPEGFAQEVVPAEGPRRRLRVNGGSVVGFEVEEEPLQAFDEMAGLLGDRGWTAVPSGTGAGGSFVKEAGRYRWVYVSCVKAGDTTCVVVQCAAADGKG